MMERCAICGVEADEGKMLRVSGCAICPGCVETWEEFAEEYDDD
ncbi:MAG: hypothetical protein AB1330_06930 [Bacillota bacterium]